MERVLKAEFRHLGHEMRHKDIPADPLKHRLIAPPAEAPWHE